MNLLTQIQVEEQMYQGGITRAQSSMQANEARGAADQNAYAKAVYRDWIDPVATEIALDVGERSNKPGQRMAHAVLLKPLNPESVALIALRSALTFCMAMSESSRHHRALANNLGAMVHSELVLTQIDNLEPDLFQTVARDLGRRRSKNLRHKLAVFRNQATAHDIELIEWPVGARDQVGMYLLGVLERCGVLDIGETFRQGYKHAYRPVNLSTDLLQKIEQIKGFVSITSPVYGPCVEPPLDWESPVAGGFHTARLRRSLPCVVRCHPNSRDLYTQGWNPPKFLAAVNNMQRTSWQVNKQVLDTILSVAEEGNVGEIVSIAETPRPAIPPWLTPDMKKEHMTPAQLESFVSWKRSVAEWHTQTKLLRSKFGRFYSASRAAQTFRDYPQLYFVYFADSRGRLYPLTYGINPQGSDLQKALLRFSEGKALSTPESVMWFHVLGANKFGFDKASLQERMAWVIDRKEMLLAIAEDPLNNRDWLKADCPLQFLAWCFEYRGWLTDPLNFKSHLPVGLDGSCNGLQHLSAMTRDPVGGAATNLIPAQVMNDIYKQVAEAATARMAAFSYLGEGAGEAEQKKEAVRLKWLAHGISRSAVKRSVMTTPYGVTKRSATDYVISDYLEQGQAPSFTKDEYYTAAQVLMDFAWPAIGDVVVRGRHVLDWLRKAATIMTRQLGEEKILWWRTPSGFIASQSHFELEFRRIATRLYGVEKIRVPVESDTIDSNGHKAGLPPNFIHSLDAAHLHVVAADAPALGITHLAMIHDDYGTHAADADKLYTLIRDKFVWLYENFDPLADLQEQYNLPTPPEKGDLDIQAVRNSEFFFS
jgi:DNA-directed RNA polymerase